MAAVNQCFVFFFESADLKMDQALLTFHNQLKEEVQVFYTTDYCHKVKRVKI